ALGKRELEADAGRETEGPPQDKEAPLLDPERAGHREGGGPKGLAEALDHDRRREAYGMPEEAEREPDLAGAEEPAENMPDAGGPEATPVRVDAANGAGARTGLP